MTARTEEDRDGPNDGGTTHSVSGRTDVRSHVAIGEVTVVRAIVDDALSRLEAGAEPEEVRAEALTELEQRAPWWFRTLNAPLTQRLGSLSRILMSIGRLVEGGGDVPSLEDLGFDPEQIRWWLNRDGEDQS